MTTDFASTSTTRRRRAVAGVFCVFVLGATACTNPNDDDSSLVEIGERTTDAPRVDSADAVEIVEQRADIAFGDSLDDVRQHGGAEPAELSLPGFDAVQWEDLIPPGFSGEEVYARYEERIAAAKPGSETMNELYEEMNAEFDNASVNPELDGDAIQMAGFVAPLTYDGDTITEFLLVPYFGACIHVPPPPANQTVMVSLAEGESLTLEESWGAVWVAGTLVASTTDTPLATAGYTISGAEYGVYDSQ